MKTYWEKLMEDEEFREEFKKEYRKLMIAELKAMLKEIKE